MTNFVCVTFITAEIFVFIQTDEQTAIHRTSYIVHQLTRLVILNMNICIYFVGFGIPLIVCYIYTKCALLDHFQ